MIFRSFQAEDSAQFLILNTACVPEVGLIDAERLELLSNLSPYFQVVEHDGSLVGGLIGLAQGATAYKSPNYRWFSERHSQFAYVDRVLLGPAARNQGLGTALYDGFANWARAHQLPVVCAEVNTVPDNPGSHRFHERHGFIEVARLRPYSPDAEVAMYERTVG